MKTTTLETIQDREFGMVHIRRMKQAKLIRLRIKNDGALHITLPYRTALRHARELLEHSRPSIRQAKQASATKLKRWQDGETIGAVYKLHILSDENIAGIKTLAQSTQAIVRYNPSVDTGELQLTITTFAEKLLRKQAMAYLPRRLKALAEVHGFRYNKVRFSSAETRWGSCSSQGTISLNIQLMGLARELIDYVIIHELCHTKHMNHSKAFWEHVERCLPGYRAYRREIKQHSPYI